MNNLKQNKAALNLFIVLVLVTSFWIGKSQPGLDINPYLQEIFPRAATFEYTNGIYSVFSEQNVLLGWIGTGSSIGYGGPLLVITGIDTAGIITASKVVENRETPIFYRMVKASDFFKSMYGRSFEEIDFDNNSIVGVTGATRTARAIEKSAEIAISKIVSEKFNVHLPARKAPLEFGFREIAIIMLFAFGIFARHIRKSFQEWLRWMGQITGLLIIGFWENSPITITKITVFLSGYFPGINTDLYWYLLTGGFVLSIFIYGKSVYCTHICPFGAFQRCIGVIGGTKLRLPAWSVRLMNIIRDIVVLASVSAALITVKPGSISYEPFATVFALKGTLLQWFLLMIVLIASLLIRNPWCHFFCPMRTCEKVLQKIRQKTIQIFQK